MDESDVDAVVPLTVPVKVAPVKLALPVKVVFKSTLFKVIAGVDRALPVPITMFPANDWSVVAAVSYTHLTLPTKRIV